MSDIFKKIKSIEPEDNASLIALGLHPLDVDPEITSERPQNDESEMNLPLNFSIEDINMDDTESVGAASVLKDLNYLNPADVEPAHTKQDQNKIDPPFPFSEIKLESELSPTHDEETNDPVPAFISKVAAAPLIKEVVQNPLLSSPKQETEAPLFSVETQVGYNSPHVEEGSGKGIIILGGLAVFAWLVFSAVAGWRLGFMGTGNTPANFLELLTLSLFVILPSLLFILFAVAVHRILSLSKHSAYLAQTANNLLTPDETVVARSGLMTRAISDQINDVNTKLSASINRMEMLGDVAKLQSTALSQSILASQASTDSISETIETQKTSLTYISELFEQRMETLTNILNTHSDSVSESTRLAEQKIREAQISIEGATNKINDASAIVRKNSVEAAGTLSGSHAEITKLSDALKTRSNEINAVYRSHAVELSGLIEKLRLEQDGLGASLETSLTKMRDMSLSAQVGAQSLSEASISGRQTVEALADAARLTDTAVRARFDEMEEMVKYSNSRAESISDTAARQVKTSLSQTRQEIARIESEMMMLVTKLRNVEDAKSEDKPKAQPTAAEPKKVDSKTPHLRGRKKEHKPIQFHPVDETPAAVMTSVDVITTEPELERAPEPDPIPKISTYNVDVAPRPAANTPAPKSSPWNWFAKRNSDKTDMVIPNPNYTEKSSQTPALSDAEIVAKLTQLGLSPAAIVDDGSIVEAANSRKSKGIAAMSDVVAKRLSDPVRHLFVAMESDGQLKTDIRAFTAQYQARLAPYEDQREAIRQRLETDTGRAFMLCDAALNA